ncbi:MAG: class I SAM-dependent methyltransferase [Phycisphaerae bacterium]|nr:class I SAM-dependent methyltransferase [Phycisphaerae bacterium]
MTPAIARFSWTIGELPFIWSMLHQCHNPIGVPDRLSFSLMLEPTAGTLMQSPQENVSKALQDAYNQGSVITGMMEPQGLGQSYGDAFTSFMQSQMGLSRFAGLRSLEIGSGPGYLLERLRDLGADVLGIDPGEHAQEAAKARGLPVIRDYFPSHQVDGSFDLILSTNVLEHVLDPLRFLEQLHHHTGPQTKVFLAVPDCEPYIERGDLSMLIHEHWSYFTEQTLRNTILLAGGHKVQVEASAFGGSLYACFELEGAAAELHNGAGREQVDLAYRYRHLAEIQLDRIRDRLSDAHRAHGSIGVFVPSRAINALVLSGADLAGVRFFDDNESLHGTYFPGVSIPVEGRQALLDCPTDQVWIMSRTFGRTLKTQLRSALPDTTEILNWEDIFE